MEVFQVRENLETLPDRIEQAEYDYLEAKANLDYMSDLKKHTLAQLMNKSDGSNVERERKALASDSYLNHIKGLKEQQIDAGKKAAYFHKLQNLFEAMRSLNKNV